jgi:hypothetical protein
MNSGIIIAGKTPIGLNLHLWHTKTI